MQSNNDIYEHYKKNPDKENVFVILSNINKKKEGMSDLQ